MLKVCLMLSLGFVFLIKGADYLVTGASAFARRLGVSDLLIGLTVVAFGTSTPELLVNVFASAEGNTDVAIGNIVGSNIFNILAILGISAIIYPLSVTRGTVWKEIPFSLLAALVLGVLANDVFFDHAAASMISRIDGMVFIGFFLIFLYYTASIAARDRDERETDMTLSLSTFKSIVMVAGGLLALVLGGKWVVDGAIAVAARLGVSQSLIGLTIVAIGTSLPELATSVVAARKKNADIAVGNVVGSNIFNIFFILGVSAFIGPLPVTTDFNINILVLLAATFLLFLFMFTGQRRMLDRWEGGAFIVMYLVYTAFLIMKG